MSAPLQFDDMSRHLTRPVGIFAGDEFLTPDSKWHRATADCRVDRPGTGECVIEAISREASETLVIDVDTRVQLLPKKAAQR